jgi:hypothetical protein
MGNEYEVADSACQQDPKKRTWREVLGKQLPQLYLVRDRDGFPHELIKHDDAWEAAKRKRLEWAMPKKVEPRKQDTRVEESRCESEDLAAALTPRIVDAIECAFETESWCVPGFLLQSIVLPLVEDWIPDHIAERRGWGEIDPEMIPKGLATLSPPELLSLLVELTVFTHLISWKNSDPPVYEVRPEIVSLAKALGVNVEQVRKELAGKGAA